MERIEREIPLDCEIIFCGDTHGGSKLTHYDGIKQLIDYVASKENICWLHGGDWCESIIVDDKRFSQEGIKEAVPLKQAHEMVQLFKPIASKCVVGLMGNHERKLLKFGNIVKDVICKDLNIPYGTLTSRVYFTHDHKKLFGALFTHHMPTLRSQAKDCIQAKANIEAALKKTLQDRIGDCVVQVGSHTHQLLAVQPDEKLYVVDGTKGVKQKYTSGYMGNGGYIPPDQRYYGSSGSFRKHYVDGIDDYAEAYNPVELGYLKLTLQAGKIVEWKKVIV
jgi:hypothetical protein